MTEIDTDRLLLRNWREEDRALFHEINADEEVMTFFPFRRSRAESDPVMDLLRDEITRDGFGFAAIEVRASGQCAGFAGIRRTQLEPHFPDGSVEAGWRLARPHWGKGYASEAARAWLRHGFEKLQLPEIVSFAVHDNRRSTAVMERIGMLRDPSRDFDHPGVPDSHPHLRRHVVYTLDGARWRTATRNA